MSAGAVDTPSAAPAAAADSVSVGLDDLIVGRTISTPIHDEHGMLLLNEGVQITHDFKEKLRRRGIGRISLPKSEAAEVCLSREFLESGDMAALLADSELSKKLDAIVDSGNLYVANVGAALKDSRAFHGRAAYNPAERARLVDVHKNAARQIDGIMQGLLKGSETPKLNQLTDVIAPYLTELPKDCDSMLTTAYGIVGERQLADHCLDTALLGMALGIEMGLDANNVRTIGLVGMMHDWSMLRVPEAIRNKPGKLTELERMEIQKHPIYSVEFLQGIAGLPHLVPLISYQIHERPDGSGYPRGRTRQSIHLFARILAVADAYVALTHAVPYRKAYMPYSAMELILRESARQRFDAEVVRHLLNLLALFPVGSFVVLSDGSVGRVLRRNGMQFTSPVVQRLQDARGQRIAPHAADAIIDLATSRLEVTQALPTPGREEIALSPEKVASGSL